MRSDNPWTRGRCVVVALSLLYSVIFLTMLIARPGSKAFYHAFNNVYQILPPLFAGIAGLLYAARGQHAGRTRRAGWACLGVAGISFAAGQCIWTYYESIRGMEVPFPGWADAGYLGAYPFLFAGVLLLFSSAHVVGRARVFLDSLIAAGGLGALSWWFVAQRLWAKSDVSLLGKCIGIAYPLGDVAVLFGAMVLFSSARRDRSLRLSSALLMIGMTLVAFFDTAFNFYTLNETYQTGMWIDWSLSFGWILIGYASLTQFWFSKPAEKVSQEDETVRAAEGRIRAIWRMAVPYLIAFSAFSVVAVQDYKGDHTISTPVTAMGAALVLLVVVRQMLTLAENLHLTNNLEALVAVRTEQLTCLHELTKEVNNTLKTEQVMSAAAAQTLRAMRADAVAIWLTEESAAGEPDRLLLQTHQGFDGKADAFNYVVSLPPCSNAENLALPASAQLQNAGAFLRVPLRWQQTVRGVIGVARWNAAFSQTEIELLESIGIEVGTALENARMYSAAVDAADRDPVTGLYNHRSIHQRLDQQLKKAVKSNGQFCLLMMDMNNFKLFNDTYGHPTGDQVLKRVAEALHQTFAQGDALARYGGDEFMAVLPNSDVERAVHLSEQVRDVLLREGFRRPGEDRIIPITLSFGIAAFPQDGNSRHELLTAADANLYAAKNSDDGIMQTTESQRANRALRAEASFEVLDAMVTAVDNKDRYTRQHSEDVTEYALWIAEEQGLSEETMRIIRIGGLLHDVGKIAVPDEILRKPGRLTDEEYEVLKRHPRMGALIVGSIPGMEEILDAVRSHHERWDGQGYPDGTAGEETPLLGRIMAVADAVSAMTTNRPYRKGLTWDVVADEIKKNLGTQFDPVLGQAFLRAARKREVIAHPGAQALRKAA